MSSSLMDTEAGGEQTQYESISTHTTPHAKQGGQLGNPETEVDASSTQKAQDRADRGAMTAENIRYGQTISEQGVGGKAAETESNVNEDTTYGLSGSTSNSDGTNDARAGQRYGEGSGVGA